VDGTDLACGINLLPVGEFAGSFGSGAL